SSRDRDSRPAVPSAAGAGAASASLAGWLARGLTRPPTETLSAWPSAAFGLAGLPPLARAARRREPPSVLAPGGGPPRPPPGPGRGGGPPRPALRAGPGGRPPRPAPSAGPGGRPPGPPAGLRLLRLARGGLGPAEAGPRLGPAAVRHGGTRPGR